MYVKCDQCGYDSGDEDDDNRLAAKVTSDGGTMTRAEPPAFGWDITCPNGHTGDAIHLD